MGAKEKFFYFVKGVIEEEKASSTVSIFKGLLTLFSFPVRFYIFLKNFAYDKKILCPVKVATKVISIGNIVSGGTGKTPFTIYLAQKLLSKGLKVAIVSRGYGAKKRKKKELLSFRFDKNKFCDPFILGDEPCLISRRVQAVTLFVGKDKIALSKMAAKEGVDVILLDDGFQSRKLYRDLDVVLVDSKKPFSNGCTLPRGLLRDSTKSLARASLIVITNASEDFKEKSFEAIKKVAPLTPAIVSSSHFSCFRDLLKNKVDLQPCKVGIFCAIANPSNFYMMLENKGFELVCKTSFFDHSSFDKNFLNNFASETLKKGGKALVCTEKDIVKFPSKLNLSLPLCFAEMDHKIIIGEKKLEEVLQIIY